MDLATWLSMMQSERGQYDMPETDFSNRRNELAYGPAYREAERRGEPINIKRQVGRQFEEDSPTTGINPKLLINWYKKMERERSGAIPPAWEQAINNESDVLNARVENALARLKKPWTHTIL